jgi:hypothetical protein
MSKQVPYRKIVTISCDFKDDAKGWGVNPRTFNTALAIKDPANNTVGAGDIKVDFIPDDKQYQQFEDWAEKRGIPLLGFTSIYDEETGEDILGGYMKELGDGTKLNEKPNTKMLKEEQQQLQQVHIPVPIKIYIAGDGPAQPLIHQLTQGEEIKEKKPRKESKQAPDRIFLFDDISEDLRSKSVAKLSRQFRHYQSKFIIATQYWKDLSKGARESTNCFIMFKGLPADKLEELRYSKGITVPQKEFERMYQIATEDIRDFFYIDCKRKDFRKNFNQKFILADN